MRRAELDYFEKYGVDVDKCKHHHRVSYQAVEQIMRLYKTHILYNKNRHIWYTLGCSAKSLYKMEQIVEKLTRQRKDADRFSIYLMWDRGLKDQQWWIKCDGKFKFYM